MIATTTSFLSMTILFQLLSAILYTGDIQYLGSTSYPTRDLAVYHDDRVQKTYLYAAQGVTVAIYDTTDPMKPAFRKRFVVSSDSVHDVYLWKNRLYTASGGAGIHVFHIDNPENPERISSISTTADEVWAGQSVVLAINRHPSSSGGGSAGTTYEHTIYEYDASSLLQQPVQRGEESIQGSESYYTPTFLWAHETLGNRFFIYSSAMLGLSINVLPGSGTYTSHNTLIRFDEGSEITRQLNSMIFDLGLAYIAFEEGFLEIHDFTRQEGSTIISRFNIDAPQRLFLDGERIFLQDKENRIFEIDHTDVRHLKSNFIKPNPFAVQQMKNGTAYGISTRGNILIQTLDRDSSLLQLYTEIFPADCIYNLDDRIIGQTQRENDPESSIEFNEIIFKIGRAHV